MAARQMSGDKVGSHRKIIFGTRNSKLALWQTNHVAKELVAAHPGIVFSIKQISTLGDQLIDRPLPEIGGKGLFTAELDRALQQGEIDIAVHSLKDLPTQESNGIQVLPVLLRADPRDVIISKRGHSLNQLPVGSVVGTSSYRRQSQVKAIRPDLNIRSIRGNVPTRISKVLDEDFDAVILAAAGVIRVGQRANITAWLSLEDMLPAPGQGMIAATCRSSDTQLITLIHCLQDQASTAHVQSERTFLAAMGGGCLAPIAAYCRALETDPSQFLLTGRVATLDGTKLLTEQLSGPDPQVLGRRLADVILNQGGKEILESARNTSEC